LSGLEELEREILQLMDENPEHRSDELQGMLSALTQRKSYFTAQPESDILASNRCSRLKSTAPTIDTSLMETSWDRSGHISQSVSILADIRLLKEKVAGLRCGVRTGVGCGGGVRMRQCVSCLGIENSDLNLRFARDVWP
jgi:hypothetical protein